MIVNVVSLRRGLKRYYIFLLLAFCLISSSLAIFHLGQGLYLMALVYIGFYSLRNVDASKSKGGLYIAFMVACFLSCVINDVWDLRLLLFLGVLLVSTPILNSYRIFLFRERLLFVFLLTFPIISLAALYCYFAGINMGINLEDGSFHDFAAFFSISMSLAAAIGIANVVISWILLQSKKRLWQLICIVMLSMSFFISVVSASRSALAASFLSLLFLFLFSSQNIRRTLRRIMIIVVFACVSFPYYAPYTGRIQDKFEVNEGNRFGSRTEAWITSFNHYKNNPVFGYGFAVSYHDYGRTVGRVETGSGWLSILFQTGILGAVIMFMLMNKTRATLKYVRHDKKLLLFFSVFVYLCLHSCFEGYILTSMLYMCLLFWFILGYLHVYPIYAELLVPTEKCKHT